MITEQLGQLAANDRDAMVDGPFGSNLKASEYVDDGVPIIRLQNIRRGAFLEKEIKFITPAKARELSRHSYRPGDVVIAKLGECGAACIVPPSAGAGVIVADVVRFRGDPTRIEHRYLVHYLNSTAAQARTDQLAKGTTRARVNLSDLKQIPVPVPNVTEQRRIADILDKADAIRRKRKEAIALNEELLRSAFLEMFGDPMTNPKGWPLQPLSQLGRITTGNTPSRTLPEYFGEDIEWIKSDNINTPSHFLTEATESLSAAGKAVGRTAPAGSTLMTCIAGSPDCIGNVALANREVAFNQQINAITPLEGVDHRYLYVLLLVGKRLIQAASTNSMKGMVSKGRLEEVRVPSAPPDLQVEFGKTFELVLRMSRQQEAAHSESERLFQVVLHQSFGQSGGTRTA